MSWAPDNRGLFAASEAGRGLFRAGSKGSMAMPEVAVLLAFRRALAVLDPQGPPRAQEICGGESGESPGARRLVAVAGSFNPPHFAHLALLQAGMDAAGADTGVFLLSVRTIDKERPSGMLLEDRLWLLCRLADDLPLPSGRRAGSVVTNRGLYVEQAAALHNLYSGLQALVFVVGYDKIVQIFDPRYYADRDAALDRLFGLARFLVAPRDEFTARDVAALLNEPTNARYAERVAALDLRSDLAPVSSTAAREAFLSGGDASSLVPERVARFISESGCYQFPEGEGPYAERAAALERMNSPR